MNYIWSFGIIICVSDVSYCRRVPDLTRDSFNKVTSTSNDPKARRMVVESESSTQKPLRSLNKYHIQVKNKSVSAKHDQLNNNLKLNNNLDDRVENSEELMSPELESFIRAKRQDCQTPENTTQNLRPLFTNLNNAYLFGSRQETSHRVNIPSFQPTRCVRLLSELRSHHGINARSLCPWNISEIDLGANRYPRYFPEATCMCERCIASWEALCKNVWQKVEFLKYEGCEKGLAMFARKELMIRSHCFCESAIKQRTWPVREQ